LNPRTTRSTGFPDRDLIMLSPELFGTGSSKEKEKENFI
jgi:hypothetical protein